MAVTYFLQFIPHLCQLFSRHDVGQTLRNVCLLRRLSKIVIIQTFP